MQLIPIIPRLLVKPEAQQMGQQIVGGLAQRTAARLIREMLLEQAGHSEALQGSSYESSNGKGYNGKNGRDFEANGSIESVSPVRSLPATTPGTTRP
jgi:hypothetical protein